VKTLTKLQAECATLGIKVPMKGRPSKKPFLAALRDYHWRKEYPEEPLPNQTMPMLLGSWDDLDEATAEEIEQDCHAWIVQPKMDGVRALLHVEAGGVRITSRTISEVTYRLSEFQDNLSHLTTGLSKLTGTILDGELVCPVSRLDTGSTIAMTSLQATMAVLAASPDKARRIQESQDAQVRFHVFDVLRYCGQDVTQLPLIERQDILENVLRQTENPFIESVPSFVVNKTVIHRRIIDAGGEGTVWKKANSPYLPGKRVLVWVKRKRGVEIEAFVSGAKAGTNGHAQMIGAVEFSIRSSDGSWVPAAWVSNWTEQQRQAMTILEGGKVALNSSFLGRKAIIVGQDESVRSRRIRHARLKEWMA
jgi:ATP-dependent DNA ligase